jgi:hypothetical protein
VSRLRAVEYAIRNLDFEPAFNRATAAQRKRLADLLDRLDADGIRAWIAAVTPLELEEMSVRQIRQLASEHGVKHYTRKTRDELIRELRPLSVRSPVPPTFTV